jgi:hypothetical protein
MTHYSVGDMGTLGPDDPPELTRAADLHIMLLPSDQSYAPAGERDSADLAWGVHLARFGERRPP